MTTKPNHCVCVEWKYRHDENWIIIIVPLLETNLYFLGIYELTWMDWVGDAFVFSLMRVQTAGWTV